MCYNCSNLSSVLHVAPSRISRQNKTTLIVSDEYPDHLHLNQTSCSRHNRSIMTFHMGICWVFTLQNKRCKFNMAAIALGLPPTGLIICLGEFLRGMGNVSNIYCRVLASSDIHCINLTWPPRRQKAGLWEARFLECKLREAEVQAGMWNSGYKREKRAAVQPFDLCCFAFRRKSGRERTGEL